jgi:hypothetical protein
MDRKPHFVFPSDPLDARAVDEHFASQRDALREAGFGTALVSDATFDRGAPIRGVPAGAEVVYRGWMVDGMQYERFASAVEANGAAVITSPAAYLAAHHLPNWYPLIRDLTPETVIFPADADLEAELQKLAWPAFFIKDYVKSLKTGAGSLITDSAEAQRVVDDMLRFRGTIEGGICVRRVERFRPDSERRYFVLRGSPFAPGGQQPPAIVETVAARFDKPFFSVDAARGEGAPSSAGSPAAAGHDLFDRATGEDLEHGGLARGHADRTAVCGESRQLGLDRYRAGRGMKRRRAVQVRQGDLAVAELIGHRDCDVVERGIAVRTANDDAKLLG